MENKNTKLPNGEAVREFYSSIETIKDYYWNKGYRKKAYLYRTLKEMLGWKMSLESFKYHFKKAVELETQTKTQNPKPKNSNNEKSEDRQSKKNIETKTPLSQDKEKLDEDTLKSMQEYMDNMAPYFQKKY